MKWEMLEGQIGYIEVPTFGQKTAAEVQRALETLQRRGAKGIILDLRNNPGGYLDVTSGCARMECTHTVMPSSSTWVYWCFTLASGSPWLTAASRTAPALHQPRMGIHSGGVIQTDCWRFVRK